MLDSLPTPVIMMFLIVWTVLVIAQVWLLKLNEKSYERMEGLIESQRYYTREAAREALKDVFLTVPGMYVSDGSSQKVIGEFGSISFDEILDAVLLAGIHDE